MIMLTVTNVSSTPPCQYHSVKHAGSAQTAFALGLIPPMPRSTLLHRSSTSSITSMPIVKASLDIRQLQLLW